MKAVTGAVMILGLSGMVAQVVLLRELLVVFSGNELYLGLFIGLWAAGEACGALLAGRFDRAVRSSAGMFSAVTAGFAVLMPVALLTARTWQYYFGLPTEVTAGIPVMTGIAALVLLPVAVTHGFLFIAACRLMKDADPAAADAVARAYTWETAGAIGGGLLASGFLIPRLDSFNGTLLLALLNAAACAFLPDGTRESVRRPSPVSALLLVVSAGLLLSGAGTRLHDASIARQWHGKNIVSYRNSPYQNIVTVQSAEQYTVFTDGLPQITLPVSDIERTEELAHFPLLLHPAPASILLLGGGAGGLAAELLKHPTVRRVDYLEPDPALLATVASLPGITAGSGLTDPKVALIHEDARVFIRTTSTRYDVVIINAPLPETLQANRIYTRQFFRELRSVMNTDGLLALTVSGSPTYYSPLLQQLNATVLATLQPVFAGVALIPGDVNLFLAGKAALPALDGTQAAVRLQERGLRTMLLSPEHLLFRFAESGSGWAWKTITRGEAVPGNDDFSPALVFRNLAYRSLMQTTVLAGILEAAGSLSRIQATVGAAVLLCIAALSCGRSRKRSLSLAVAATGMAAMIAELLLMAVFQVFYGSLYHMMGILLAVFMAGIVLGSYWSTTAAVRCLDNRLVMLRVEAVLAFLLLSQGMMLSLLDTGAFAAARLPLLLGAVFLTGSATGMTYPVASRLCGAAGYQAGGLAGAGHIYAVDLVGGCAGGVIGGLLLLPALGMKGSFLLLGLLKGVTTLIFYRAWRKPPESGYHSS